MGVLVCGDLHGRVEIVKRLLDRSGAVAFIGDYLDSWNRSTEDQIETLDLILDAVESRSNVYALMGNHELSYLDQRYQASGWSAAVHAHVMTRKRRMWDSLNIALEMEGFLLSHAGVSQTWLREDITAVRAVEEFVDCTESERLFEIGRRRGGHNRVGGPLWCDTQEFTPIPGVKQVFGHTEYRENPEVGIYEVFPGNYNIDCLGCKPEFLMIDNGNAAIVPLEELG